MARARPAPAPPPPPPGGFAVRRDLPLGRHPILEVFPGLDRMPTASRLEPNGARRARLFSTSVIEVVDQDVWMYVAPWARLKSIRRRRFDPVVTPSVDCIVVGREHLASSSALVLFLDIFHELCHLLQRHRGEELFDRPESYVKRPTELAAYRFVIDEARRIRVEDSELREYLRVEWISESEFSELLGAMGVSPA